MSALVTSFVILAIVWGTGIGGTLAAPHLSPPPLSDYNAREFFKAIRNIIISLTSLSLGLLVTSAKTDFQRHMDALRAQATSVIVLDRVLRDYGPGAQPARVELHRSMLNEIRHIRDAANGLVADAAAFGSSHMGKLRASLIQLEPTNDGQAWLKTEALKKAQEIVTSRWRIYEDLDGNLIWHVVAALVFWLMGAFFSIGVIMPRHAYALGTLFVTALFVAIAMFLIIELSFPYDGMITVSPRPLDEAVIEISTPAELE